MIALHRLATPYADRPAFGRSLNECAECGALVEIPHVAICARGDMCDVCSAECKMAHEETHGYGACEDCSETECAPHRAQSDAIFAARDAAANDAANAARARDTAMLVAQEDAAYACRRFSDCPTVACTDDDPYSGHSPVALARLEATYRKDSESWHCAWSSCSRLFIPTDRRYTYCGHPDCPATRGVPEHAQPADETPDAPEAPDVVARRATPARISIVDVGSGQWHVTNGADAQYLPRDYGIVSVAETFGMKLRHRPNCPDRSGTDGTMDCDACGQTADRFFLQAERFLTDVVATGRTIVDPGYFE